MAWTGVETRQVHRNEDVTIKVLLTSDGSAGSYALDTYLRDLQGLYLYALEVVPGAGAVAPNNTFDIDVEDENTFHLLDTDANSNTATTWNPGDATLGQYPKIRNSLSLIIADIGAAADQITVYIHAVGGV